MAETSTYPHIEETPGVCGGRPRIEGTRIRVLDIAVLHRRGDSPADILEAYPHLTLAKIYAALAYYYDHKDEIEDEFVRIEEWVEQFKRLFPDLVH